MLKRKIDDFLKDWKQKDKKKSLVIEGPRQVGKTTSVVDFAEKYYQRNHYIYVNFSTNPLLIDIFDPNLDAERLYNSLKVYYPDKKLVKGESLIILDEIQLCPRAIIALKSFTSNGAYDVIGCGSFLENTYKEISSFPVGYIERYSMGSLDFEEFLWANDYQKDIINVLADHFENKEPLLKATHNVFLGLFREYMAIGGMPKVVSEYVKNRDFKFAYSLLEDILEDYYNDILKYCDKRKNKKVNDCIKSLPIQLYKDYKKFQYSIVSSGGRSSMYESSVEWLIDSGILLKSTNVEYPKKPLHSNVREDTFKLYVHDVGLFVAMLGDEIQLEILRGGLDAYNGAIYETVVASMLHKLEQPLYYYEKNSKIEVDFLITMHRELYAVEVKGADNPKSKVLQSLHDNYDVQHGIKLGTKNIDVQDNIVTFPIYMAMFLARS